MSAVTLVLFLAMTALAQAATEELRLKKVGELGHPAIKEASGLVKSRQFPGVFWTHNDSGNPAALFAVKRDGTLIREFEVAVPNVDWEDIATDNEGYLYIGDIGNNDNRLPLRAIYKLKEPDPNKPADGPLKALTASYYRFAQGERFDAEGLVIDGKRALVVAKTFDDAPAPVYAIPLDPPAPLLRPAKPQRVATLPGFTRPATGASLSADGKTLAVCSTRLVGVYQRSGQDGWRALAVRPFRAVDQVEAIAWDGDDLLLAGEARGVFLVPSEALRAARSPDRRSP